MAKMKFFLTRILSCFVLSWDFWKTNFLDLSRTEIFDYLKFLSCLASKITVLIYSCLEFQDFVSVSSCLVSRKTCLDPPLVCFTSFSELIEIEKFLKGFIPKMLCLIQSFEAEFNSSYNDGTQHVIRIYIESAKFKKESSFL